MQSSWQAWRMLGDCLPRGVQANAFEDHPLTYKQKSISLSHPILSPIARSGVVPGVHVVERRCIHRMLGSCRTEVAIGPKSALSTPSMKADPRRTAVNIGQ
jgi:hypothetical protein